MALEPGSWQIFKECWADALRVVVGWGGHGQRRLISSAPTRRFPYWLRDGPTGRPERAVKAHVGLVRFHQRVRGQRDGSRPSRSAGQHPPSPLRSLVWPRQQLAERESSLCPREGAGEVSTHEGGRRVGLSCGGGHRSGRSQIGVRSGLEPPTPPVVPEVRSPSVRPRGCVPSRSSGAGPISLPFPLSRGHRAPSSRPLPPPLCLPVRPLRRHAAPSDPGSAAYPLSGLVIRGFSPGDPG